MATLPPFHTSTTGYIAAVRNNLGEFDNQDWIHIDTKEEIMTDSMKKLKTQRAKKQIKTNSNIVLI